MQADAAAQLQALHALLDAALQPEESEALQVCVLEFVGDQIAAAVQSAAVDAKEPQQLLQRLIETSMVRTKVCSASAQCPPQHLRELPDLLIQPKPSSRTSAIFRHDNAMKPDS